MRAQATLAAFLVLAAAACGSQPAARPGVRGAGKPCRGLAAPTRYEHVLLIVLENHGYTDVADSSPYLNGLARACGLAEDYTAVAHPSLPNYLALTSGSTDGVTSDCTDCSTSAPSLFEQLGDDWRSYLESMPVAGDGGPGSGRYAKKHNPAAYYTRIAPAYARDAVPLGSLPGDLSRASLGRFSLVVPDLCNDEHDCGVDTGDRWLQTWVPRILGSPAYRQGRTALFVTYDEGVGSDNRVYTVVVAPSVPPFTVAGARFDHYSLLRTIERMLGLPCLAAACTAAPMDQAFHLLAR
jgi:phospholipase C